MFFVCFETQRRTAMNSIQPRTALYKALQGCNLVCWAEGVGEVSSSASSARSSSSAPRSAANTEPGAYILVGPLFPRRFPDLFFQQCGCSHLGGQVTRASHSIGEPDKQSVMHMSHQDVVSLACSQRFLKQISSDITCFSPRV